MNLIGCIQVLEIIYTFKKFVGKPLAGVWGNQIAEFLIAVCTAVHGECNVQYNVGATNVVIFAYTLQLPVVYIELAFSIPELNWIPRSAEV